MLSPQYPAVYARRGAAGDARVLVQEAAQRGWPVPAVYCASGAMADGGGPGLGGLEAAIGAGRHDALLMPLPGTLGNAARLMRLLRSCTRHGVMVSFVPVALPAGAGAGQVVPGRRRRG